jgi:hypothetical protein
MERFRDICLNVIIPAQKTRLDVIVNVILFTIPGEFVTNL